MDGKNITVSTATTVTKQNRFKSWALWTSIAALVVWCVKEFGGIDISSDMNAFLNVALPVVVSLGIINNPTDSENI